MGRDSADEDVEDLEPKDLHDPGLRKFLSDRQRALWDSMYTETQLGTGTVTSGRPDDVEPE